jgi:hypothetical protein
MRTSFALLTRSPRLSSIPLFIDGHKLTAASGSVTLSYMAVWDKELKFLRHMSNVALPADSSVLHTSMNSHPRCRRRVSINGLER